MSCNSVGSEAPRGGRLALPREWCEMDVVGRAVGSFETVAYEDGGLINAHELNATALAARRPISDEELRSLTGVKCVSFPGTGVWESINVPLAQELGISVSNIRDYASATVAEHTLALMLSVCRRVTESDRAIRGGAWQGSQPMGLHGKTLGLIGTGFIGTAVARLAEAFGMRVLAWRRRPDDSSHFCGIEKVSLQELLTRSDVVSVHSLAVDGQQPVLGPREFAAIRHGAILINTARASLVDEEAMVAALADGRLRGAGLDVYGTEPLPQDSPLIAASNTVLTPHVAASGPEVSQRAIESCVLNLVAYLEGRPTNVVQVNGQVASTPSNSNRTIR